MNTNVLDRPRSNVSAPNLICVPDFSVRTMFDQDLGRVSELRELIRRPADRRSFDLLRGMRGVHWAIAETRDRILAGMVGAVPLGEMGIVCHLAVHDEYCRMGLGSALSSWAVSYLRSWGSRTVRLYSTRQAEGLFLSLGFEPVAHQTDFRLESEERAALRRLRETSANQRTSWLSLRDLPELCGVDRRSSGMDRAALIVATLRKYPGPGFVARDFCDRINGYLLSSITDSTTRIGPFVAATPAVARALLTRALEEGTNTSVEVAGPDPDSPVREVLEELGFASRLGRLRMELGETPGGSGPEQYATTPYLPT